jgi:hypothetical protein
MHSKSKTANLALSITDANGPRQVRDFSAADLSAWIDRQLAELEEQFAEFTTPNARNLDRKATDSRRPLG